MSTAGVPVISIIEATPMSSAAPSRASLSTPYLEHDLEGQADGRDLLGVFVTPTPSEVDYEDVDDNHNDEGTEGGNGGGRDDMDSALSAVDEASLTEPRDTAFDASGALEALQDAVTTPPPPAAQEPQKREGGEKNGMGDANPTTEFSTSNTDLDSDAAANEDGTDASTTSTSTLPSSAQFLSTTVFSDLEDPRPPPAPATPRPIDATEVAVDAIGNDVVFECDYNCGAEGNEVTIGTHELTCEKNPDRISHAGMPDTPAATGQSGPPTTDAAATAAAAAPSAAAGDPWVATPMGTPPDDADDADNADDAAHAGLTADMHAVQARDAEGAGLGTEALQQTSAHAKSAASSIMSAADGEYDEMATRLSSATTNTDMLNPLEGGFLLNVVHILGGPGAGKGAQVEMIVAKYRCHHFSASDLLRAEAASGSEQGREIERIMKEGMLVPHRITVDLLRRALETTDTPERGFLLDGFPRAVEQAETFEAEVTQSRLLLWLDCSKKTLAARLDGHVDDDDAKAIKKRFKTYRKQMKPVLEYFDVDNRARVIDSNREPDVVFEDVAAALDGIFTPTREDGAGDLEAAGEAVDVPQTLDAEFDAVVHDENNPAVLAAIHCADLDKEAHHHQLQHMIPRDRSNMVAWSEEEEDAVVKIQAMYRGHSVRQKIHAKHNAATVIQSNFRGYEVRKELADKGDAAATIQGAFRDYAFRKNFSSSKRTEIDAATGRRISKEGGTKKRRSSVIVFSDGMTVRKTKPKKGNSAKKKKAAKKMEARGRTGPRRIRPKIARNGEPVQTNRRIMLYKNGDPSFPATNAVVTEKAIVHQELAHFLSQLTGKFGGYGPLEVVYLLERTDTGTTFKQPENRAPRRVKKLEDFVDGNSYVVSKRAQQFKWIDYTDAKSSADLEKMMNVRYQGKVAAEKAAIRSKHRAIKIKDAIKTIFLHRNGVSATQPERLTLVGRNMINMDQLCMKVRIKLKLNGKCKDLCTLDGKAIVSVDEVQSGSTYVAVGAFKPFEKMDYAHGAPERVGKHSPVPPVRTPDTHLAAGDSDGIPDIRVSDHTPLPGVGRADALADGSGGDRPVSRPVSSVPPAATHVEEAPGEKERNGLWHDDHKIAKRLWKQIDDDKTGTAELKRIVEVLGDDHAPLHGRHTHIEFVYTWLQAKEDAVHFSQGKERVARRDFAYFFTMVVHTSNLGHRLGNVEMDTTTAVPVEEVVTAMRSLWPTGPHSEELAALLKKVPRIDSPARKSRIAVASADGSTSNEGTPSSATASDGAGAGAAAAAGSADGDHDAESSAAGSIPASKTSPSKSQPVSFMTGRILFSDAAFVYANARAADNAKSRKESTHSKGRRHKSRRKDSKRQDADVEEARVLRESSKERKRRRKKERQKRKEAARLASGEYDPHHMIFDEDDEQIMRALRSESMVRTFWDELPGKVLEAQVRSVGDSTEAAAGNESDAKKKRLAKASLKRKKELDPEAAPEQSSGDASSAEDGSAQRTASRSPELVEHVTLYHIVEFMKESFPTLGSAKVAIGRALPHTVGAAAIDAGAAKGDFFETLLDFEQFRLFLSHVFFFNEVLGAIESLGGDAEHILFQQFAELLQKLDANVNSPKFAGIFAKMRSNNLGVVRVDEVCLWYKNRAETQAMRNAVPDIGCMGFTAAEKKLLRVAGDPHLVMEMWKTMDTNGNRHISFTEFQSYIHQYNLPLDRKPALMRAFQDSCKANSAGDSNSIDLSEFPLLLANCVHFHKLYRCFQSINTSDRGSRTKRMEAGKFFGSVLSDHGIDFPEFVAGLKKLEMEVDKDEARCIFDHINKNGKGWDRDPVSLRAPKKPAREKMSFRKAGDTAKMRLAKNKKLSPDRSISAFVKKDETTLKHVAVTASKVLLETDAETAGVTTESETTPDCDEAVTGKGIGTATGKGQEGHRKSFADQSWGRVHKKKLNEDNKQLIHFNDFCSWYNSLSDPEEEIMKCTEIFGKQTVVEIDVEGHAHVRESSAEVSGDSEEPSIRKSTGVETPKKKSKKKKEKSKTKTKEKARLAAEGVNLEVEHEDDAALPMESEVEKEPSSDLNWDLDGPVPSYDP